MYYTVTGRKTKIVFGLFLLSGLGKCLLVSDEINKNKRLGSKGSIMSSLKLGLN